MPLLAAAPKCRQDHGPRVASLVRRIRVGYYAERFDRFGWWAEVRGLRARDPILRVVRRAVEPIVDKRATRAIGRNCCGATRKGVNLEGGDRAHAGHQMQ